MDYLPSRYAGGHYYIRTGTFLAKKIFSKICSSMNWCCIFLSSRDSIHALDAALHDEPIHVLGHNHWVWGPRSDRMHNYRFIHFYREPFRKILSGYRYHYDGIEEWTRKVLPYEKSCAMSRNSSLNKVFFALSCDFRCLIIKSMIVYQSRCCSGLLRGRAYL